MQITNTLEQMDTPPIVRFSTEEAQSHLPINVVQLGTSISSPALGHGSMEKPSDKGHIQQNSSSSPSFDSISSSSSHSPDDFLQEFELQITNQDVIQT